MKLQKLVVIITLVMGLASSESSHENSHKVLSEKSDSVEIDSTSLQMDKEQYVFINSIQETNGKTSIDVDFVQYLTGQQAIEAAAKAGEADTFRNQDGEVHLAVPNDYFILNESNKVRHFELAEDCVFDIIINPDRTNLIEDNSLMSLKKVYTDSPFIIRMNKKGIVTEIKEVFTP